MIWHYLFWISVGMTLGRLVYDTSAALGSPLWWITAVAQALAITLSVGVYVGQRAR